MSDAEVTRAGTQNRRPDIDAVTGAKGRGPRARGEERMVPRADFQSYYGKPVINQPVWKWPIPAYLFSGGLAAGSSLLALGADLTGNEALRKSCRYTALGAITASAGFLVGDLGKPTRFHHMLRVVKLTSPMSVGTWILTLYGPGAGLAGVSEFTGILPRIGSLAGVWAALMAPPVATYTAVLVADTAVPAWHGERYALPFAFAGSAMAASGGLAMALDDPADARPARRLALVGGVLETVATKVGRRQLGEAGEVYDRGKAGRLRRASDICTAAGLATAALLGKRRLTAAVAGGLLVAGSALERLAVYEAGFASANDPKYTVRPQRARVELQGGERQATPHITSAHDVVGR